MARIRFVVAGYDSHKTWAEGYRNYCAGSASASAAAGAAAVRRRRRRRREGRPDDDESDGSCSDGGDDCNDGGGSLLCHQHDVRVDVVPTDRWKYRMQSGCPLELLWSEDDEGVDGNGNEGVEDDCDCDILVVDGGMFDVSTLVAVLHQRRRRGTAGDTAATDADAPSKTTTKVVAYMHENQLTTPFSSGDRDFANGAHWHYGMAHWRTLLACDGLVFNSYRHLQAFSDALPALIKEQCPPDLVDRHVRRCHDLLRTKCAVLRYGLELDELLLLSEASSSVAEGERDGGDDDASPVPVVLWNARLEEDKDPGTFLEVLSELRRHPQQRNVPFRLIALGRDPSKDQKWYRRIRDEFASDELLHLGWCSDRAEYASWLRRADVVISTARHETFGISIVESAYCGALPLLPNRLSYPELFDPVDRFEELHFYSTKEECVDKLIRLLSLDSNERADAVARTRAAVQRFRWSSMGIVYDRFFASLAAGADIVTAGLVAEAAERAGENFPDSEDDGQEGEDTSASWQDPIVVTDAGDPRVAMFRPRSLRDHDEYHGQLRSFFRSTRGYDPPSLHGGRRATVRMLEAVATGSSSVEPVSFLTTAHLAGTVLAPERRERCRSAPVYVAEKELLDEIRGQKLNTGDAVLAVVRFPVASPLEDLIADPPILVLEDCRNGENVGSILRTAFCLGITSVVASGTAWAALRDSRSARCSMGAVYYHKFYKADGNGEGGTTTSSSSSSLASVLGRIRRAGIQVHGIEIGPDAVPVAPHHGGGDRRWAAVLGNEDAGLTAQVRAACDRVAFVPQVHGDSLNVGHAAAIALFVLGRDDPTRGHDGRAACT